MDVLLDAHKERKGIEGWRGDRDRDKDIPKNGRIRSNSIAYILFDYRHEYKKHNTH